MRSTPTTAHARSRKPWPVRWLALGLAASLQLAGNAFAHGGEDHGDAAAPPPATIDAAPRATAASDEFELVAAPQGDRLLIYLDRFATNEPVAGAKLEIESGAFKAVAQAVAPGVYAVAGNTFIKTPGRHALTITIEAAGPSGAIADLLAATLDVAAPAAPAAPPATRATQIAGLGPTALVLLAALVVVAIALLAWRAIAQRRRVRAGVEGATP